MSTASTTSSSRRRAARIKQIREKQSRVITPRNGGSDGGGGGGDASSVASSADDNVGAVIVDVGSALLSSERGSGGGSNGGGGGDASSVASSKSRTRGQRAAAYRARKAAKAAPPPPPPSVAAAHHHPPIHPPTAGSGSGGGGRVPSPSPHAQMMQIDSVMSSASDVVSTASHHTTSSQMTAKAANTPQGRERSSSSSRARPSSSDGERRSRSVSVPRASSSRRSASPSPARPSSSSNGGGSRSASLRKLRSENPSLLPSRGSATTRPSSVGRSRSRSVEPSGRYDDQAQQQQQQPPTPPTPVETIRLGHDSSPPTSDIDSCDVTSPSSPLSASSSKSEHLSVEKGIRLLQNIESTHKTTDASPSPRPASQGRAPSPFRRHNNSGSNTPTSTDGAPSSSPAPSPRPDPPRESPTPSRKTAWDRAQRAVEAQMDAPHSQEEVGRAPPMEPEEVTEIPPPSPRQPPTQTRASPRHHQPDEAASVGAPAMLLSPDQEEARLQAEEEIRHLEARASVMKQQMERQAEILVRQEAEIMHTTDPTAVYGQGYLPPNLPPTPQFSQYDYNDPAAPQQVASFQQPSAPVPPLPNDPYSPQSPARMNAAMPSYQSSSSQMMQQRGYSSSPNAPPSPLMHPQGSSPYGAPPMTQPQPAPAYHPQQQQPYGMEQQQQHAAPAPQDYGMHYQSQPPHLQLDAVESFRAQEQQSKYREYTLSPASQGAPTPTGSSPYHHGPQMTSAPQPPPAQQYHHQQGGAYPSAQQGLGFTAEPIVSHMHHQSRNEMHTYEEATRETSQSMAVNPNVQSAYGSAGPREGSEANMSEPSFDPSSISHLTQSTYRTVSQHHPHPHEQQPATIPSASDGTPGQSAPSPRPVAPVLSPEAFKSAPTSGFESDSESDFDNPTFSPQSADIKSNGPSVTSKAISEAGKSGSSWWKEPFDDLPGAVGKKDKALQSVAESHFDSDGFPVPETMPPPPVATQSPTMSKSVRTSSTVHRPVRLPSPAMNSVASGQASHFTAASAATADSLGRRLAAKLNINPDDDEDIFSGLEDGTVLPSASTRPASKSHDDIFDGVASPGASPTDASHKAASKANISLASRTSSGVDLNTVDGEGRKALMDDVTSFGGTASFVANKRPSTNTSTHNQSQSLNLEYSVSTPAEGVLGMEQDEPKAAGLLGSGNGTARKSQFVMGMEDQNILEFEDAGTVTSDITSSIIDTGLTARKEAYEAYAATAAAPSVRYEPILEDDAESTNKSRASTSVGKHAMDQQENDNYEDEDTFDADVNTIDNTVDNTLDNTFDTAQSRRRGDKKAPRRKGRKSRRQYESDSYSEDTYDDIGGSTVMTSTSGVSSGIDFFASFGCGVLDAIATQCAGHGRRPRSFDERSLDDDLYNDEEGPSFDRTLDNSTLNGTLGTATVGTDLVDGSLSRKVRWPTTFPTFFSITVSTLH